MKLRSMRKACAIVLTGLLVATASAESGRAKDIVLSRLAAAPVQAAPVGSPNQAPQASHGMSVSVLVAGADGLLYPQPTGAAFKTGDRFRLRVLPTADGTLVVANTSPDGASTELLRIAVKAGQETLIPAESDNLFQLDGQGGEEQLHLRLFPAGQPVQSAVAPQLASKDIRLTTQSTATASYVVGRPDQSLYSRIVMRHQ